MDDLDDVYAELRAAAASSEPPLPDIEDVRQRVRRRKRTRVISAGVVGVVTASAALVPLIFLAGTEPMKDVGRDGASAVSLPSVLRLTCDDGALTASDPTVAAQADGVHISVQNEDPTELVMFLVLESHRIRGGGRGDFVYPVPPHEPIYASCDIHGSDPEVIASVEDPNGAYLPPDLDCGSPVSGGPTEGIELAPVSETPVAAARILSQLGLADIREDDELQRVGYRADPESALVVLERAGGRLELFELKVEDGRWVFHGSERCR